MTLYGPRIDQIAAIYDVRASQIKFDGTTYIPAVNADIKLLKDYVGRPESLCDVGCGLGWHLEAMMDDEPLRFWGIDVSAGSLEAFVRRCPKVDGNCLHLILGNVACWKATKSFDTVTSFLSCLGQFSVAGDREHLGALARLLRPGGFLLASMFCEERVDQVAGDYITSYTRTGGSRVKTSVTYEPRERKLLIRQMLTESAKVMPAEVVRLYRKDEIAKIAKDSGLRDVEVLLPVAQPGQAVLMARAGARP